MSKTFRKSNLQLYGRSTSHVSYTMRAILAISSQVRYYQPSTVFLSRPLAVSQGPQWKFCEVIGSLCVDWTAARRLLVLLRAQPIFGWQSTKASRKLVPAAISAQKFRTLVRS
jgi:hypothetical protein